MNEKEKKQQNSQKQQTQDKLAERINWVIHFRSEIYCREVLSLTKCKGHLIYLDMVLFCHLTLKNSVPAGERERESCMASRNPLLMFYSRLLNFTSQTKILIIDPKRTSNRDQGLRNQRKKNKKHIFCKI